MAEEVNNSASETERYASLDDLNLLGKVVYAGGLATRLIGGLVDWTLDVAVDAVVRTERAFLDGLDDRIEEAKVLEEYVERDTGRGDPD